MEAFALFKFWKTTSKVAGTTATDGDTSESHHFTDMPAVETDEDSDADEEFFELELALPDYSSKSKNFSHSDDEFAKRSFDSVNQAVSMSPCERNCFLESPIETKPRSKISIIGAALKLRISMIGRLNKAKLEKFDSDCVSVASTANYYEQNSSLKKSSLLTMKFQIEDASSPIKSKFKQTKNSTLHRRNSAESSKRFSKDALQRCFDKIKPLYVKASKRYTDKASFVAPFSPSTASFPSPATSAAVSSPAKEYEVKQRSKLKVKCRRLGKSKSAVTAVGVASPPVNRKDDSLTQQNDGIEGAILHCKRSFNSSTGGIGAEPSWLWRCSSDPSNQKSIKASS